MDPNELGIDEYYALSQKDRDLLDDWLRSLGGNPTKTRKLILDPNTRQVRAEVYVVSYDGKLTWNKKTKDVEIYIRTYTYVDPPPIWR